MCGNTTMSRSGGAPDRLGFHLPQTVGVALQWSWPQVRIVVPFRRDPPVRSHDRVPMGRERNMGRRSDFGA